MNLYFAPFPPALAHASHPSFPALLLLYLPNLMLLQVFGWRLYNLLKQKEGNMIMSPFSVSAVMAMVGGEAGCRVPLAGSCRSSRRHSQPADPGYGLPSRGPDKAGLQRLHFSSQVAKRGRSSEREGESAYITRLDRSS